MKTYAYNAALWCEDCAKKVMETLPKPDYPKPWDTDDYPSSCPEDGGGESDCPQHCDGCGAYLENPLTNEGVRYVLDEIEESFAQALDKGRKETWDRIMPMKGTAEEESPYLFGKRHVEILREWARSLGDYHLDAEEGAIVDLFLRLSEK